MPRLDAIMEFDGFPAAAFLLNRRALLFILADPYLLNLLDVLGSQPLVTHVNILGM